ncbi:helix-turn-helix transcriptional regulator [Zongyangia hominis]|uniref:Helix-turn-helix transcriptional regulator n=1 Tax=Zongyangia hominis TaxID=2763677 RepID=A0A926EBW9_9FIRM|nr:helix-turn-helix transcriptional regulator [Zongyangia hominis]MBC8570973.1 helix-turn-helix transcriptional regulator [Zongyangia hominis]
MIRQIGLNIAYHRKRKGYTQEQLADRVPMSRGHLSHIESYNVQTKFSVSTLLAIAKALEIEPKLLFEFRE